MSKYTLLDIAIEIDGKGSKATKQKLYRIARKLESEPITEDNKLYYNEQQRTEILSKYNELTSSKRQQRQTENEQQQEATERAEIQRRLSESEQEIKHLTEQLELCKGQIKSLQEQLTAKDKTIADTLELLNREQALTLQSTKALEAVTKHRSLPERIKGLFISDKSKE